MAQVESAGGTRGIRCLLMRGGTSKGAYFLAEDLPSDPAARDDLLLRVMGSPDDRQIDGIGGAHPLTSKVAVVSVSEDPAIDVDYLFLQVSVSAPEVSDAQNCGNLLAGIGPFAVERGLVTPGQVETVVRINMVNTGVIATATFATPGGVVDYDGDQALDGVPGTAAPIRLTFSDTAGSTTGTLLPTGHARDEVEGVAVTLIDNGMPSVMISAADLGVHGDETPQQLEDRSELTERVAAIRVGAAALMGLGDVSRSTVPKMVLLSPPTAGGTISTRSFIPLKVHTSIGVFGATTVAAAVQIPGAVGNDIAVGVTPGSLLTIEHPTGHVDVGAELIQTDAGYSTSGSAIVRTARKLFDGEVFPRPRL